MKALVCLSRTPDTTTKIAFDTETSSFIDEDTPWILNPYDEWYALVRALELKEAGHFSSVDFAMVGTSEVEPTLRKAIALGGDGVFRIDSTPTSSSVTARALFSFAKERAYNLILGGRETIDYNGNAVMAQLSTLLEYAYAGHVMGIDINDDSVSLRIQIAGGYALANAPFPLVVACQKGVSEQRLPSLKGKISARSKAINVVSWTDTIKGSVITKSMKVISSQRRGITVSTESVAELFTLLKENHQI